MTPALPLAGLTLVGVTNPFDPSLGQDLANAASGQSNQSQIAGASVVSNIIAMPSEVKKASAAIQSAASLLRPARVAAFVVGLLLIAGGIFALKPVREAVRKGVETGRKVATIAAEAAA